MNIFKKHPSIRWVLVLLLLAVTGAALAAPKRLVWNPNQLNPSSIAPGEIKTFTVTLRNTGPGTFETEHVAVQVTGAIVGILRAEKVKLPKKMKQGEQVQVSFKATIPASFPMSVVNGDIVLIKQDDNEDEGKDKKGDTERKSAKKIFLSNILSVSLTISSIPLPPDPGEAGKIDLLGVDLDNNGVRDDIDRYIVFNYPDSAKKREALKQESRALNLFLRDAGDKTKTRANAKNDTSLGCLEYVFGADLRAAYATDDNLIVQFLNTPKRSRVYSDANGLMGGNTPVPVPSDQLLAHRKASCIFDADSLPN
ncbi:MAG: hypothetical protein WCG84_03945 [Candidatus Moraniibacteriota bacterium]